MPGGLQRTPPSGNTNPNKKKRKVRTPMEEEGEDRRLEELTRKQEGIIKKQEELIVRQGEKIQDLEQAQLKAATQIIEFAKVQKERHDIFVETKELLLRTSTGLNTTVKCVEVLQVKVTALEELAEGRGKVEENKTENTSYKEEGRRKRDQKLETLNEKVIILGNDTEQLQKLARKNNVLVSGLPELEEESEENLKKEINSLLRKSGVIRSESKLEIDCAHRLGKRKGSRTIKIRMLKQSDANLLLRTPRLGGGIYFNEDLSEMESKNHFLIRREVRRAKGEGKGVENWKDRSVRIDGDEYLATGGVIFKNGDKYEPKE